MNVLFILFKGMVGFNYVIELVPDKKYGALDPDTGEWNGIVRQILEKVSSISKPPLKRALITFNFIESRLGSWIDDD